MRRLIGLMIACIPAVLFLAVSIKRAIDHEAWWYLVWLALILVSLALFFRWISLDARL